MADQNVSVTDFEEGARRALEWLGRSDDAAELAQIFGEMPAKLGDMEIAFLIAIGRAALAGHKAAPQDEAEAKTRPATLPPPAEAPVPWVDGDEFRRRRLAHERAARFEELARRNGEAFMEQLALTTESHKQSCSFIGYPSQNVWGLSSTSPGPIAIGKLDTGVVVTRQSQTSPSRSRPVPVGRRVMLTVLNVLSAISQGGVRSGPLQTRQRRPTGRVAARGDIRGPQQSSKRSWTSQARDRGDGHYST